MAAGSVSGVLAARGGDVGVLWVDAHADINAPGTSPSGNLHGTPVSFLLRELAMSTAVAPGSPCTPALPPGWEWLASVPALLPTRLAYIGLRDLDPGEKAAVRALGLRAFTMADVDRLGIGAVMEQALDHIAGEGEERGEKQQARSRIACGHGWKEACREWWHAVSTTQPRSLCCPDRRARRRAAASAPVL